MLDTLYILGVIVVLIVLYMLSSIIVNARC